MKNFKIILLSIIGLFVTSCDLDEDPIFLDSNAVYSDISVAKGALDGIRKDFQIRGKAAFCRTLVGKMFWVEPRFALI